MKLNMESFLSLSRADAEKWLSGKSSVVFSEDTDARVYEIISSEVELEKFLLDSAREHGRRLRLTFEEKKSTPAQGGAIVVFDILRSDTGKQFDHLFVAACHCIFLGQVQLSGKVNQAYFHFFKCHFLDRTSIDSCSYARVLFRYCEFYNDSSINGDVNFIEYWHSKFIGDCKLGCRLEHARSLAFYSCDTSLLIQSSSIDRLYFEKCRLLRVSLNSTSVKNEFVLDSGEVAENGYLHFNRFRCWGFGKCSFGNVEGKVRFEEVVFNRVDWDFSNIENQLPSFKCIVGGEVDHERTCYHYTVLKELAKNSGGIKNKLRFEYLALEEGIASRKSVKGLSFLSSLSCRLESALFYLFGGFCNWKVIVRTNVIVICFFAMIYIIFPNLISINNVPAGTGPIWEMILSGDMSFEKFQALLSNGIYFSMITFATVGYGDISPVDNFLARGIAGFEGLVGVLLISFLSVSIVRRYVN